MPNNLKNSEKNTIKISWNVQFTKIKSRKKFEEQFYKKITKRDFVMAFMFSFIFVFWVISSQNPDLFLNLKNNFKADLFDTDLRWQDDNYDAVINSEFKITPFFYPKVIKNWKWCSEYETTTDSDWNELKNCIWDITLDYYVPETPDNIIEIWIDKLIKDPACPFWQSLAYRFQWTNQYLKFWETLNESSISSKWVNYPILSTQKWINANYKIDKTWTWITIFFDKNIKNWKYYDFAMKDWITIYKNYKTLEKFIPENLNISIKWNELNLIFSNKFETDFWRIIVSENLISDLDWRINNNKSVVWKNILDEIVIDNKKPIITSSWKTSTDIIFNFDENIYENLNKNIETNIFSWTTVLSLVDWYSEYNIEWNELKIIFSSWSTLPDLTIWTWAIIDKNRNENNKFY